jgi:hypothetical protein
MANKNVAQDEVSDVDFLEYVSARIRWINAVADLTGMAALDADDFGSTTQQAAVAELLCELSSQAESAIVQERARRAEATDAALSQLRSRS